MGFVFFSLFQRRPGRRDDSPRRTTRRRTPMRVESLEDRIALSGRTSVDVLQSPIGRLVHVAALPGPNLHQADRLPAAPALPRLTQAGKVRLTGVEGKNASGVLLRFRGPRAVYRASINWGDGKSSTGRISAEPRLRGTFRVQGSHLYRKAGKFVVRITITPDRGKKLLASTQAIIARRPQTIAPPVTPSTPTVPATPPIVTPPEPVRLIASATGGAVRAEVGAAYTGAVAQFSVRSAASAGDFVAAIDWGDGHQSAGTVEADPGTSGAFVVRSANTYARSGAYTVTVQLRSTTGESATATSRATITTAGPIKATGIGISALTGAAFSSAVAVFTPPAGVAASYNATVNWGDGQSSAGTVQADPQRAGSFRVVAAHSYVASAQYDVTVTVQGSDGSSATARTQATVVDPSPLLAHGVGGLQMLAATSFTGTVATFSATGDQAATSTATIDWGDGESSAGTVGPDPRSAGTFAVIGSHTYGAAGSFTVAVTLSRGSDSAAARSPATVSAAGTFATRGADVAAAAGIAFTGAVASLFAPVSQAADFAATIDWGDGTSSSGMLQADPDSAGRYDVVGTHTYAAAGDFNVVVAVARGDVTSSARGRATVTAAGTLAVHGLDIAVTAGTAYNGIVATLTTPDVDVAGYQATIDWGDGRSSGGTIEPSAEFPGTFTITGSNTYTAGGTFALGITVQTATANVMAAGRARASFPLAAQGADVTARFGVPFAGDSLGAPWISTFTDGGIQPTAPNYSGYSATVDWGDGSTSEATAFFGDNDGVTHYVSAPSHIYAAAGTFDITVTVRRGDGASATSVSQATVLPARGNITGARGINIGARQNEVFSGPIATFTIEGLPDSQYRAFITWGDGSGTFSGTIAPDPDHLNTYIVSGSHTYIEVITTTVSVEVQGTESLDTVAVSSTARVFGVGALQVTGVDVAAFAATPFSGRVATIYNPDGLARSYSATIDWGDGQSSTAVVTADASVGYVVDGSHTYASTGTFTVRVHVTGSDNTFADASSRARSLNVSAALIGAQPYVRQSLRSVQEGLSQKVFGGDLPLFGRSLRDSAAAGVISAFSGDIVNALAAGSVASVRQDLLRRLGPAGRGLLRDSNGDGTVDLQDVTAVAQASTLSFALRLHSSRTVTTAFDAHLPALPLELGASGRVSIDVGFDWALTFGVRGALGQDPAPFLTSTAPLTIALAATLDDFAVAGSLGFFSVEARDDAGDPSGLRATYTVDVAANRSGVTVTPSLSGAADLNLELAARLGAPDDGLGLALTSDLYAHWALSSAGAGPATIAFNNIRLDLGSFMGSFLGPVISQIQSVTEPLQPVVDFLETSVPILSDLFGDNVTFADILDSVADIDVRPFVDAINTINDLSVDDLTGTIALGSYDVTNPTDVQATSSADVLEQLEDETSNVDDLIDLGFSFPVLRLPEKFVDLLLGREVTFFTWQPPALHGELDYEETFYPIADIPVVYVTVAGSLTFDAGIKFGFDSAGLRSGDLWHGFFAQGTVVNDDGDRVLAQLTPSLSITVGLGPGDFDPGIGGGFHLSDLLGGFSLGDIIELSGTGRIQGTVEISLNNANRNGIVRADHIDPSDPIDIGLSDDGIVASLSYDAAINLGGFTIGIYPFSYTIPGISLGPGHVDVGRWQLWPTFRSL